VQFIRSEENAADILNKNCPEKLHTKHANNIRDGTLDCWREDVEDGRLLPKFSTSATANTVSVGTKSDATIRRNVRFELDENSESIPGRLSKKDYEINRESEPERIQQPTIPSETETNGKSLKNIREFLVK
jgi:hypothetical protein